MATRLQDHTVMGLWNVTEIVGASDIYIHVYCASMCSNKRTEKKETKGPCGSTETAGVCLELHSGDACSGNSHKHLPFRRFPSPSGCKGGSTLLDDHGCLCWLGPEKSLPPQHSALRAVLLVLLLVLTESAEPSASLVLGESVAVHQR